MKENSIEEDIKIIEKYLSHFKKVCSPEMLKKDEIIKVIQYKEIQALQHILTNYKRVLKDNKLRDKTIELMAEYIESKNLLIDKNFHVLTAESIKEYFKNKVKRIDFLNKEEKKNIETFIEKCKKYDESVEIKGVTVGEESRILDTVCKTLNQIEKLQKENEKLKNKLLDTLDGKKVIEEETPQYIKENYISKEKIEEWRKSKDKSLMWSNADDLYYFNKWTKELLESEE